MKLFLQRTVAFAIALALVSAIGDSKQVPAQTAKPANNSRRRVRFVPPPPPKGTGTATDTRGAAARGPSGSCPYVVTPLTALVPTYKTESGSSLVWGLTVAERPTFWFYIPYTLTSELPINFRLDVEDKDKNGKPIDRTVYETTFNQTGTPPGIASFRLPSPVALEVGKKYYWYFAVLCDPSDSSAKEFVRAAIQRHTLSNNLRRELEAATPQKRIVLYAINGLWYETLNALAELHRKDSKNAALQNDWNALLTDVELKQIARKPIVGCCTPP